MKKTVALHNLGCKVNAYELEAIQQLLENRGYEIVPFAPGADVYIINTCTVTNIADRKSRQMLHKAKKMNPDAVVVACGCYVQAAGEKLEEGRRSDSSWRHLPCFLKTQCSSIRQSYQRQSMLRSRC